MSSEPFRKKRQFQDYCLVLQVHPEADAAMIDAAYWHLAMRYNEATAHDPHARKKLEELNEAYNVLGSPDRRDEYMKVRAAVLGEGALPVPPPPPPEKPPLAVMARQRPRPREPLPNRRARQVWVSSALTSALALPFVLGLAIAAFLAGASPVIVGSLLAVVLLLTTAPLAAALVWVLRRFTRIRPAKRPRPPLPISRRPSSPRARSPKPPQPAATLPLHPSIRSRAAQLREHDVDGDTPQPRPLKD